MPHLEDDEQVFDDDDLITLFAKDFKEILGWFILKQRCEILEKVIALFSRSG